MKTLTILTLFLTALLAPPPLGAEEVKLNYTLSLLTDEQGAGMQRPEAVACVEGGVVAADTGNGRLLRYALEKGSVASTAEVRLPELGTPVQVRVAPGGGLLALDGRQQRLVRIGDDGAFKGFVEPAGLPDGRPLVLKSFALDGTGGIYLLDVRGGRVLVLLPDGKYVRQIALPPQAGFPSDVAVTAKGTVLVVDSVQAAVYAAEPSAAAFALLAQADREQLGFPTSLAVDHEGMLYVLDRNAGSVVLLRPNGTVAGRRLSRGWKEGFLNYPSGLCINGKGDLYIAERSGNRVQLFSVAR